MKITEAARLALSSLTVFRGLLGDDTINKYLHLLESARGVELRGFLNAYGEFYCSLLQKGKLSLPQYIDELLIIDNNIFSSHARSGNVEPELISAAENDLRLVISSILTANDIKKEALKNFDGFGNEFIKNLPEWRSEEIKFEISKTLSQFDNR